MGSTVSLTGTTLDSTVSLTGTSTGTMSGSTVSLTGTSTGTTPGSTVSLTVTSTDTTSGSIGSSTGTTSAGIISTSSISSISTATTTASSTDSTSTASTMNTTNSASTSSQIIVKNYRLPKTLKPYMYDLTVKMTFDVLTEPFYFDGILTIHISCLQATNTISIHKRDIDINSTSVIISSISNPSTTFSVLSTMYDEDTEIVSMTLSQSLQANQNYSIAMIYIGETQANNFGFYKSFYYDSNGVKKLI